MTGLSAWLSDPAHLIVIASVLSMLPGLAALALALAKAPAKKIAELQERISRLENPAEKSSGPAPAPEAPAEVVRQVKTSPSWPKDAPQDQDAPPPGLRFV